MRNRKRREPDPFDGILLINKPTEWTSHDVVAKVRSHFKFSKVGHGGTLDPLATGLLVLLIGKGTKLSDRIMGGDKVYEGVIHLGITTDSQDRDGEVLEEKDASHITREQVEAAIQSYLGDIEQIPPMVSAIKKNGVPLYKMARKGQVIEREPRKIHIYSYDVLAFDNPLVTFRVKSTKGTYVRTLAHDLGNDLGVGGSLDELRRTESGPLNLDKAYTLDEILECDRVTIGEKIIHLADMLHSGDNK
ncbi:tRNA pseudouridine(55) synthase TruB [Pontiella sulfatireligans]|uniref:tRNA pseudouridine synthase B n=1 Tax=Pontiella sulfatireligans TaxID=2750658 RepID=A0A6C2UK16_9BACT|nr:tRNA pseudouridine(55) synthase TruB [Pontiella sulfatireligans]VGO20572.1 tRNA pseudouridine synthase B [Pontiella sulfatireligans]